MNWNLSQLLSRLALVIFVCHAVGCGNSGLGTVTGTVHLDGEPLPDALVTFQPQAGDSGDGGAMVRPSMGRTDEQGKYELVYSRDKMGAVVGEHKVSISTYQDGGGGDYGEGTPEKVPTKYNIDTELTATVTSGQNTIDFLDLESEGEKYQGPEGAGY